MSEEISLSEHCWILFTHNLFAGS